MPLAGLFFGALLVLAAAVVLLPGRGPGGPDAPRIAEPDADGVRRLGLAFGTDYRHPFEPGRRVQGQRIEVPSETASLVPAAPHGARLAIRLGNDGGDAGEWMEITHPHDEGPDTASGELVGPLEPTEVVAAGVDAVDGPAEEGTLRPTRAMAPVLLDPGDTIVEVVDLTGDGDMELFFLPTVDEPGADDGPPVVAGRLQTGAGGPDIVPRSGWTSAGWADDNGGCTGGPWYADNLQAVVVHHTVTGNDYSADRVDDVLRAVLYSHVSINGWCDIGYNFLVDRFGTIWEGRTGGVDRPVIGGHAKGFNTGTMGVALLGQHQRRASPAVAEPTTAARDAVFRLAEWKLGRHGVDPAGTTWLRNRSSRGPQRLASGRWHLVPTVLGHRHVGLTSCPGDLALAIVDHLRANLRAPDAVDGVHRVDGWSPHPFGPGLVVIDGDGDVRVAGAAAVAPATSGNPAAPPSPRPVAVGARFVGAVAQGWILHGDGVLHPFGGAPAVAERPAGARDVVDLVAAGAGGGWVAAVDGTVHGFGGRSAPVIGETIEAIGGAGVGPVVAADLTPAGDGYLLHRQAALTAIGSARPAALPAGAGGVVDVAVRPSGSGGWAVEPDGTLHAFGGAPAARLSVDQDLPAGRQVVAVTASASGNGGWVATDDGQLWPFGRERLILPLSTDAAASDAVDATFVGSIVPSDFARRNDSRWFNALSELFRGAPATPNELERWDGWMTFRGGRREVALDLARSPEYQQATVDGFYQEVLGRPADPAGRAYWLDRIAGGTPVVDIGVAFYASPEYVAASGSTAAYVERLYRALLRRPSDPTGAAEWTRLLERGRLTPTGLVAAFYLSEEYRRNQVVRLYDDVLGRPPDPGGLAFWAQRIGETDDVIVAAELAVSDEFYRLALQ
ncbi:MAG: DUF4214 domain-containing protein [Actinomycetota bacterium]